MKKDLYVANSLEGAFVETFVLRSQPALRVITMQSLKDYWFAEIAFPRPLHLVDLTGPGLVQLGIDSRICAGGDYSVSQQWALALWQHPDQPDGILYRSRHDPSMLCAAVFDRVTSSPGSPSGGSSGSGGPSSPSAKDVGSLLESRHRSLLKSLLNRYGFGIVN